MKIVFVFGSAFLLSGCLQYNYGVKKETSPIPYKNLYTDDDNDAFEFYSNLFKHEEGSRYQNYVEITHLSDVYNHYAITPKQTWKQSKLMFNFTESANITLIPSSVNLQHYTMDNKLIKPFKVVSNLTICVGKKICGGESLQLYYDKNMPKKVIEKVSFQLIINGKSQKFSYTIPLEYQYDYSFWDQLMGI